MKKKLAWLATPLLLVCVVLAEAQQSRKVPRIALVPVAGDPDSPSQLVEAFRNGLRELGYHEGKNILIEYRYPAVEPDQVTAMVNELLRLNVDVLVSSSSGTIQAARQATKTTRIVMITAQDPIQQRLVISFAHPGGNITGIARLNSELSGKRLELLKELIPAVSRVGILGTEGGISLKDYEPAADALKIQIQYLEIRKQNPDFDSAFQDAVRGRVNAVITVSNSLINRYRHRIVELAIQNRLPSMFPVSGWVQAGGLISYSANDIEIFRRAATYVDKILKGAKPAELPIERPTRFELVINVKTAKQIRLVIPPHVLARADRVLK